MFLVRFCCANSRDNEGLGSKGPDGQRRDAEGDMLKAKNVLLFFKNFEHSLKLKKVDFSQLLEMVLDNCDDNQIPKKDL